MRRWEISAAGPRLRHSGSGAWRPAERSWLGHPAIEDAPGVFLEAVVRLRGIAQDRNGARIAAERRGHAMQRARALEQDERARVLFQLLHLGAIAIENAGDRLETRRPLLADVGREFEQAARLRLAQHQGDGEDRVVEMPTQLLVLAIEI